MSPRQDGESEGGIIQIQSEGKPLLGDGGHGSAKDPPSPWTVKTTAALAFTMLVQSFLLIGVFPYAGFLAMHLIPSLDEESVGRYAGLIGASFMFGRMLTSYAWGKAADRHGRTNVLKASLILSAFFSVLFGLAPTLPLALAARFALGLSNSLLGVVQTIVTELSRGDNSVETRGMAIVLGAWGYGFLINPAIAGYLADPVSQYPASRLVEALDGILNLTANPFLLPNLVGGVFCIVAYALICAFVEETLPADQIEPLFEWKWRSRQDEDIVAVSLSSSEAEDPEDIDQQYYGATSTSTSSVRLRIVPSNEVKVQVLETDKREDAQGEINKFNCKGNEKSTATIRSLLARQSTRKHLTMYWTFSFLVISIDETFPLYCMSKDSGLGVTEKMIGNLLSGAGLVFLLLQFFLLTYLVDRHGVYKTMRIGALFSVPLVCFIPLTLITNRHEDDLDDNGAEVGTLTWSTLGLMSVIYAIARAFAAVTFSTITMSTNRTVPAHQRATMNGLSMTGGSVVKAAGPVLAGLLFSESVGHITPPYGAVFAWGVIACLGLGFFVMTVLLPEHVEGEEECDDDNDDERYNEENERKQVNDDV